MEIENQLSKTSRERYLARWKENNEALADFQENLKRCELQFIKALEENLELFARTELLNEEKQEESISSPVLNTRKKKPKKKKSQKKQNHLKLSPPAITSTAEVMGAVNYNSEDLFQEYGQYCDTSRLDNYNSEEDLFEESVQNFNTAISKTEGCQDHRNVNQQDSDETYCSDAELWIL